LNILGIETSCDETAVAVVQNGRRLLSSVVSTQIKLHQPYAGVVPELASRSHVLFLNQVIESAIKKSRGKVDAIAVTVGPGLVGALLVGKMMAETLGWVWNRPVYAVNHIEAHLLSAVLEEKKLEPPFLGLVVSGGHTELIFAPRWADYRLLGRTRDDAAGEAFDKVAKMMNLGYPGGPAIDRLARKGNPLRYSFPRAWLPGTWDFSFSGLKTALLYKLREKKKWSQQEICDLCAGFQQAVVDVLVGKTMAAAQALRVKRITVGGGVAANSALRRQLAGQAEKQQHELFIASLPFCTDNAAMVAASAYFKLRQHPRPVKNELRIQPQWHIPFLKKALPSFRPLSPLA
jgi:N6-L-threonylcarbamoyladenine synthase